MRILTLVLCLLPFSQAQAQDFFDADIAHFWEAYDRISASRDSAEQYALLDELFISKGSPGLKAFMEVRNYTPKSYIDAIRQYPRFWNSVRKNTYRAPEFIRAIRGELVKLKRLYPPLTQAPIYFTIGALRSGGTTRDGIVLIGSEIAMTDSTVVTDEFPAAIARNRRVFFDSNPIGDLVLLNVHEYVHTQQKPFVNNLLAKTLYEGVAEFVSCLSSRLPSATPAVHAGKKQAASIRAQFEAEMFSPYVESRWLWGDAPNAFQLRDLGYYVGYAICEAYYTQAADKRRAVQELIELDYSDEAAFGGLVERSGYFSAPLDTLYARFEQKRPLVAGIQEFAVGSQEVDPALGSITLTFSEKMHRDFRSTGLGDLGRDHFPKVESIDFADDGMSVTYKVKLEPGKQYQLLLENGYRSEKLIQLKPYLVEFKTRGK